MTTFQKIFALSILVFAFAAITVAQNNPASGPGLRPTPTPEKMKLERDTKFDGNVNFPDVEGWELSEKYKYPTADLGYSVNYESREGGRVTVYVYSGGKKKIPSELTGIVADEMKRAKSDINAAVDQGMYQNAKALKSETTTIGGSTGGVKALYASYDLTARGNALHSEIYIFPYQNYFIKIRATRPKTYAKSAAIDSLLAELDTVFLK